MASYCFCGCGRRVRFGKKRLSGHGDEVRRLVATLEISAVPIADAAGSPQQRAELSRLMTDGKRLEGMFRDMVHGYSVAPPPISGISGWFQDASRVARAFETLAQGLSTEDPVTGSDRHGA